MISVSHEGRMHERNPTDDRLASKKPCTRKAIHTRSYHCSCWLLCTVDADGYAHNAFLKAS
uniref:Uncharacterized protein n=1 Tax=Rhizobium rhizogenes TaxID=359 RepID=A0A7S5DQI9_RHIRH|nr:hypothetical protein pC6.5b_345 [Rhizobium rhizogenes]